MNREARLYVIQALQRLHAQGIKQYADLLESASPDRVLDGLSPWALLPTPERSSVYCSEAIGRPVLPFAQAIGEDMIACFEVNPNSVPAVVVINPWAENKAEVVQSELPHFDAWLSYAKQVSRAVQVREQEEADDE